MPHTLGPIWRDANVRSGPSLDSHIQRHLLPGDGTSYQAVDWVKGDEVVEGENPNGEIVSDIWFQLTLGGWCSAVNFEPDTIAQVLGQDSATA
ncbi:hypothetical protein ABR738_20485 [Streptomyces sp. Edi4]|uniref:hypothetical protein n=1 Tax=Streptomyces sp. Edi4 TaxID=3162527 RepID=UPI0033068301